MGVFGQLDEDLLGDETLVAYAAAAGTTAADGTGRNSPYTTALLAHLDEPLEILTLFRRVRARVLEATNGEQRPHEYQSLLREHYLSGAPTVEAVTVEGAAPDVADVAVTELDVAQLRVLAVRGDADAQSELGGRYEAGREGVERDYGEAVTWYRRAAEQGHAAAQAFLGFLYSRGRGVGQDDAEAVRWYRRSAEQGHPLGQVNLGVMYSAGRSVGQDFREAVRWYRRSAEQGHPLGQNNLGVMYRDGRGVVQDYEESIRWFRRSAEQGNALAQTSLGAHVRHRARVAGGRRGGGPLVSSRRRTGQPPGAVQPRHHVRVRSWNPTRPRRGGSVVPLGGRPRGTPTRRERLDGLR